MIIWKSTGELIGVDRGSGEEVARVKPMRNKPNYLAIIHRPNDSTIESIQADAASAMKWIDEMIPELEKVSNDD